MGRGLMPAGFLEKTASTRDLKVGTAGRTVPRGRRLELDQRVRDGESELRDRELGLGWDCVCWTSLLGARVSPPAAWGRNEGEEVQDWWTRGRGARA